MVPIKNLNDYTQKMSLTMKDKLFFVEKIKTSVYIDYGCADGTLLCELDAIYNDHNITYIGYDRSNEMIELAKSKWGGIGKVLFTSNFEELLTYLQKCKDAILILSSVLHEILSQGITQEEFWSSIKNFPLKYIVIRDMAYNPIIYNSELQNYCISKIYYLMPKRYNDFVKKYGKIDNNIRFCHFLLKYRYTQNWERELNENYFSFNPDCAIKWLNDYNFYPIYYERFNVPYIVEILQKDMRINLNDLGQTHIKMIFQKC